MYLLFAHVHTNERKKLISKTLDRVCETYKVVYCIGSLFSGIDLIDKKRFMCQRALEIGQCQEPEKKFFMEEDYYVQIVCSCAFSCIGRARYLEEELQELKHEDDVKGTEFYNTLKQYLLGGNNVSLAAKELFIHRNTMIYRISRISEILRVDINDPIIAQRLLLSIILQEQEREKWNGENY